MEPVSFCEGAFDVHKDFAPGRATREALERLYATGHWLYSRARFVDASSVFRIIVLCLPEDERGYLALGACHEGLGQEGIALEIYNLATLGTPSAPHCHVARARILRRLGRGEHADAALEEAESIASSRNDAQLRDLVAAARGEPDAAERV